MASVTGSGTSYIVTINTGSGRGKIRLKLVDNDSIINSGGSSLGGPGIANGDFTGPTCKIVR